jgi:purine-nucleoside/S-methyl-5'-thioadenosine phosphorylase / adenosine deaminase
VTELHVDVDAGRAVVRFSDRGHGDLNADVVAPDVVEARWRALADRPVTWVREVHGTAVVTVTADGPDARVGDALVTADPGVALGIWVGDCAPVALVSSDGIVGAVHAGWRGLAAGVLGRTVRAMREMGAGAVVAVVGPCIHAECYEFGAADLDILAARFGDAVVATTSWGAPALDVPAAVTAALATEGVTVRPDALPCTACDRRFWSHRARRERERHGMAVWFASDAGREAAA